MARYKVRINYWKRIRNEKISAPQTNIVVEGRSNTEFGLDKNNVLKADVIGVMDEEKLEILKIEVLANFLNLEGVKGISLMRYSGNVFLITFDEAEALESMDILLWDPDSRMVP
ncbi:hypothetical protein V6N11_001924 [Hibiscus sabdariffa]|uniref:DUF4283 domain-containing protein n=1 Tax=Hibiscus sabdariffa TaxID=183260 RepID=A0ABR2QTZ2_9ROSI